jgi:hypothetical protein
MMLFQAVMCLALQLVSSKHVALHLMSSIVTQMQGTFNTNLFCVTIIGGLDLQYTESFNAPIMLLPFDVSGHKLKKSKSISPHYVIGNKIQLFGSQSGGPARGGGDAIVHFRCCCFV